MAGCRSRRRGAGIVCNQASRPQSSIEIPQENNETIRQSRSNHNGSVEIIPRCNESNLKFKEASYGALAEQSGREFEFSVSTTGTGDTPISANAIPTKIHRDPFFSPQSLQSGTSPLLTSQFQSQPNHCSYRVAAALFSISSGIPLQTETGSNLSDSITTEFP